MPFEIMKARLGEHWRGILSCALLSWSCPTLLFGQSLSTADLHNAGTSALQGALGYFVWDSGILTDELIFPLQGYRTVNDLPIDTDTSRFKTTDILRRLNLKDIRSIPELQRVMTAASSDTGFGHEATIGEETHRENNLARGYLNLQAARAILSTAIAQLPPAATGATQVGTTGLRSELYALLGYTEIMLADLYCSGVPLNAFHASPTILQEPDNERDYLDYDWVSQVFRSLDAQKAIVYRASSTTAQVYRDAIAKFDTALTLTSGQARPLNLARVGKGRAWLNLGQYDSAAAAVALVPKGFVYPLTFAWNMDWDWEEVEATVADHEGENGLPFVSSGDPRTETGWLTTDKVIRQVRVPSKYWMGGDLLAGLWGSTPLPVRFGGHFSASNVAAPFDLANGVEAVLITAEARLHDHPNDTTWLHLLNELRATAPIPGTTQPNPHRLPPLSDPGTDSARVALLFQERAYWLFLTGHRQGDLRRLVREYHWPQDHVYPTGSYVVPQGLIGQAGQYGTDVNLPIPPEERANPNFHGCIDRHA